MTDRLTLTRAHWFSDVFSGVPVQRAALDDADLSVMHIGPRWSWLVRRDGHDVTEGAADSLAAAQQAAEAAAQRGRGMTKVYTVHAEWDEAAKVWATNGEDIPGLFCEAASFDELVDVILDLAPDLLRANGAEPVGQLVDIRIIAERHGSACIAA